MISRNPPREEFVKAFLSDDVISFLAKAVNDTIAYECSGTGRQNDRKYKLVSSAEVTAWILQRLELSIDVKITIDAAYNSVWRCLIWCILRRVAKSDCFS